MPEAATCCAAPDLRLPGVLRYPGETYASDQARCTGYALSCTAYQLLAVQAQLPAVQGTVSAGAGAGA